MRNEILLASRWFLGGILVLAMVPTAKADTWTASVLYPLLSPAGFNAPSYTGIGQGQAVGYGSGSGTGNNNYALMWSGTSGSVIDLQPNNLDVANGGITSSRASAISGGMQVGYGNGPGTGNNDHALLWNGSADSAVDLSPTNLIGFTNSYADATDATQQAGYGLDFAAGNQYHAMLWTGSSSSAVDLNPTNLTGYTQSYAYAVNGDQEVGYGYNEPGNYAHALLWTGSAGSAIDLNPSQLGMTTSVANGTDGTQQVGHGHNPSFANSLVYHALLWNGTAGSAVDLNPTNIANIQNSYAQATNGLVQVGYAWGPGTANDEHAFLWSGTPDSAIDLHNLLPGAFTDSLAYDVDPAGDVFGIADGTYDSYTGSFAVEWSPIVPLPEPGAISALVLVAIVLLYRPRPHRVW